MRKIIAKINLAEWGVSMTTLILLSLILCGYTLLAPEDEKFSGPEPVIKTVVIDPGHGGKDTGCRGADSHEKDVVLKVAKRFGDKLKAEFPDLNIIYTRSTDKFVPLDERAEIANRNNADVFISLHVNAHRSQVSGSETYVMGLDRAEENLAVAKRENEAILLEENYLEKYHGYDPNSDEGHIWLSLVQNAYLEQSIDLATLIQDQFVSFAGRKSRGVKQAGFVVLRMTTMPSVLVELGFLSNHAEEIYLNSEHGLDMLAGSLFNAFRIYKETLDGSSTESEDKESVSVIHEKPVVQSQVKKEFPVPVEKPVKPEPKKEVKAEPGKDLTFKVQLSASKSGLDTKKGKWLEVDNLEVVEEDGYHKYLASGYANFNEAVNGQILWRKKGFDGAFVVAYHLGERISLKKAKEISGDH